MHKLVQFQRDVKTFTKLAIILQHAVICNEKLDDFEKLP